MQAELSEEHTHVRFGPDSATICSVAATLQAGVQLQVRAALASLALLVHATSAILLNKLSPWYEA
jgi:hypothetical protein